MKTYDTPEIAPTFSNYSHAAEAGGDERWLHISGQVGVTPDGELLEGFEAQAEQSWRNIEAVLESAGMGLEHIVKITMLLTSRSDLAASRTIRDTALRGGKPACTLFVVAGLADERWLIEIEAVAAAPPES
jgi:2-iminobutanoate/2-iminopropanoate deaminase